MVELKVFAITDPTKGKTTIGKAKAEHLNAFLSTAKATSENAKHICYNIMEIDTFQSIWNY